MQLPEPPPWVRIIPNTENGSRLIRVHPLAGQVVPTNGRDHGSMEPAIFVRDESGKEFLAFDTEWENVNV